MRILYRMPKPCSDIARVYDAQDRLVGSCPLDAPDAHECIPELMRQAGQVTKITREAPECALAAAAGGGA